MNSITIHHSFLKDIGSTYKFSNKIDLQGLLELLNSTNDVNLQVKVFLALSAYVMFNKETNLDVIIRCSAVYDRIHNVLAKGLPRKAANALNFLSALLYVDTEEDATTKRRTLALYAKNMTRSSGCLGVMTDMFTNCMLNIINDKDIKRPNPCSKSTNHPETHRAHSKLVWRRYRLPSNRSGNRCKTRLCYYHDTWKALCQCLAVACAGCEINQSYCTHLIPVCIQKCSQTNIDIFLVLQSLVLNHNRNIQLFLECNGISVFTRELLHYNTALQLLTTMAQCPAVSTTLLRNTKVLDDLRDFLRLYGPGSQIGQTAMIILNHIESRSRGPQDSRITKFEQHPNKIECKNDMIINKVGNELDDTKTLMQNVLNEVFKYRQDEPGNLKKAPSKVMNSFRGPSSMNLNSTNKPMRHRNILNQTKKLLQHQRRNRLQCNVAELSFSFLQNNFLHGLNRNSTNQKHDAMTKTKNYNNINSQTNTERTKTQSLENIEKDIANFYTTVSNEKPTEVDLKDFRPIFSSTPKHEGENSNQMDWSKISMCQSNLPTQMHKQRTTKLQKRKPYKLPRNINKDLRNRSLSSRFFSAINDSCTTLVKTVTNIFKKKETPVSKDSQKSHSSPEENNRSYSHSFLNYMQKRDAVLNNKLLKGNKDSSDSSNTKSCETCDDTEVLKKKLTKDVFLKQTVKKLKVGINLYGCDFKKISRTMWPRESYMTPVVLYNLYRKLLLK